MRTDLAWLPAVALVIASAHGQCPSSWTPGGEPLPGLSGPVTSMVKWDPDGAGPLPVVLVVGGVMTHAGTAAVSYLATWDGTVWKPLDDFADAYVSCMTVHNGQLIIARRDAQWSAANASVYNLGPGAASAYMGNTALVGHHSQSGSVAAFVNWQGQLVAAGTFTHIGEQPAEHVALWNGAAWQPLAPGASPVYAAVVHMGQLVVSNGQIVRRWNGASWSPLGSVANGWISAVGVYGNEIFAGGGFGTIGGQAANLVARWDGAQWRPLAGSGTGTPGTPGNNEYVQAIHVYNGELIIGGRFNNSPGTHVGPAVRRWNGSEWQNAGTGLLGDAPVVYALQTYNGALIAGGSFYSAGGRPASNIAAWSPATNKWYTMGSDRGYFPEAIRTLASHDGQLIATGPCITADGESVGLARRDSAGRWRSLGGASVQPEAVVSYGGDLVIGGAFNYIGSVQVKRIARWDGLVWQPLHWGMTNTVRALTVHDGKLIAGGYFAYAGGQPVNRIASWDGAAWSPLGSGFDGLVWSLGAYEGDLIAGGPFSATGGRPVHRIARWDGAAWQPLGAGLEFSPNRLAVAHDRLVAFGNTVPLMVKQWNGGAWQPVYGLSSDGSVYAALEHGGDLLVGGRFSQAGFSSVESLARWDGVAWHPLPWGPSFAAVSDATVMTLAHDGQDVLVGGTFMAASDPALYQWAQVRCGCYPDCDGNQSLTVGDFGCFQTQFAAGQAYSDCNGDGQRTVADFGCFQTRFAAGCP